ncbi:hypothetical protein K437DRAFT_236 [Tilletiaria anomala UBC 951]|uniref:Uncharacterized protein n=1 Tax=Tilletiaria anomala (strain ATCC 24038 / CBS 436.72 / UBC 951) TaxID=1037660 RepID=A0A066WS43_TILAU|nr:uncharacterized protein K437DRAFT_236 [Tilletiaria anomala UBC 951]KDN53505.1 hypothetical protein K437DRAFT_236 [Tilletiaria anomala UBC 951]
MVHPSLIAAYLEFPYERGVTLGPRPCSGLKNGPTKGCATQMPHRSLMLASCRSFIESVTLEACDEETTSSSIFERKNPMAHLYTLSPLILPTRLFATLLGSYRSSKTFHSPCWGKRHAPRGRLALGESINPAYQGHASLWFMSRRGPSQSASSLNDLYNLESPRL